jgi:hypothetical protein
VPKCYKRDELVVVVVAEEEEGDLGGKMISELENI